MFDWLRNRVSLGPDPDVLKVLLDHSRRLTRIEDILRDFPLPQHGVPIDAMIQDHRDYVARIATELDKQ
jgi:hypothetical protein